MKELLKSFEKYREYRCVSCGCPMELKKMDITYLGSVFSVDLPACPSCGMAFVPEELATGKMLEVEKILEDK
ncbi:hypothetical protein C8D99_10549 [Aminivibrio pyruvatiphilus]|uniref:DUF7479 domain-containing protein n=1 Tax=Aminivibrio pyruvatiphilus TaxID=1005740 RepID=A0A4R8MBT2_9BACT|nr:CLJU_RS11820 family redox protein [Aminivibrio pyruvatiphilus]TDY61637.1 hypothetical protein C8D99_10549 [Aminivibrio pyruvatiphilus]